MTAAAAETEPIAPTDEERTKAQRLLAEFFTEPLCETQLIGPGGNHVCIPESVARVLARALDAMAQGNAVCVVPYETALTTRQAADVLNVSRQHLVRLLDEGAIPYHRTGTRTQLFLSSDQVG